MDFLKSAVASAIAKGTGIPYTFGDRVDNEESIWALHNGTKKEDKSACSIFTFDIAPNRSRLPLAQNAAKKLRTLRHPGIIKVLDTIETDTNIYIVTERLAPLSWHVKRKSISEETAKWGLHAIASTLKFVNDDAKSVHGAIRVSSIFTSESGEWKLGGFELLSSMNDEDAVIYRCGTLLPDFGLYAPPEVANSGWAVIKKAPLTAADSYGYGILNFEVFSGPFRGADQLLQLKSIPPSMQQSYKRLVNANPKLRVSPGQFLEQGRRSGGFFETPLIRLTQDIDSLGLKSEEERDTLISELEEVSDDFPEDFFKSKVMPELMKSVEFGGGGPKVFSAILKIGSKLSDDEFESRLVPLIIRLFASPDRAMRVCLLDALPQMIDKIPQKIVNDKIFPQLLTGFTDTAPVVREQTVKSVLTLINKLSDRIINGELLRYLAKTANDEQPGIRTNTTICLGKIAKYLGASSRSKVLVAAFSRGLRDPFVHARNAALMALSATIDVFSEDDCATKILPALCPSLLDKEKMIRDQANKTLDSYIQRVRKYSSTMADTALPPEGSSAVNPASARIGNQNDTSGWAGWAISSFTNKLAAANGEIQANGMKSPPIVDSRPSSVPPPAQRSTTSSHIVRPTTLSTAATPVIRSTVASPEPSVPGDEEDVMDAWGTMDDEDDQTYFDASSVTTPPPAPNPWATAPSSTTATPFEDNGEPDFAGWLAAQNQAKSKSALASKKPLPKGLTKSSSSTSTTIPSRPTTTNGRTNTGPSVSSGLATKKVPTVSKSAVTAAQVAAKKKTIDTKPKEDTGDQGDDWGAWD